MECEDEPAVVDKFYGGVSVVDRDSVREGIAATLALVPDGCTFDFWGEIVAGSEGC